MYRRVSQLLVAPLGSEVHSHIPDICKHCGEELSGTDEQPYRHQVVEIPELSAYVIEHQLHQRECACCGRKSRGELPSSVPSTEGMETD